MKGPQKSDANNSKSKAIESVADKQKKVDKTDRLTCSVSTFTLGTTLCFENCCTERRVLSEH